MLRDGRTTALPLSQSAAAAATTPAARPPTRPAGHLVINDSGKRADVLTLETETMSHPDAAANWQSCTKRRRTEHEPHVLSNHIHFLSLFRALTRLACHC